jgi:hypothetical protein
MRAAHFIICSNVCVTQIMLQNRSRYLQMVDAVVEMRAPNLIKLQILCEPHLTAEVGVAHQILDRVAKLTQLQALDIPGFKCLLKDVIQIAYLMPNLRYA